MKIIKISHLWTPGQGTIMSSLLFNIIKKLSKKQLVFVKPKDADILIIGSYNIDKIYNRIVKSTLRRLKFNWAEIYYDYFQRLTLFRKVQPITIFFNTEPNLLFNAIKSDFSITSALGVNNERHLRIPVWKENIDWSKDGLLRSWNNTYNGKSYIYYNILRFGSFYDLKELLKPQGKKFLEKKNICIFSTHMNEPRKTMYEEFSKNFVVNGYGKYFQKNIINHNMSNFNKKEIMKNYSFNLCPHNVIYPGIYEEKVPEAFLGKCLPITWSDQNISYDFNPRAFVNLNDYIKDNFKEIIYLLKQREFLEKFTNQPLLISKPNLEKEFKFVKKIIDLL
jgi:hypothetical protein